MDFRMGVAGLTQKQLNIWSSEDMPLVCCLTVAGEYDRVPFFDFQMVR